jgi:hypothetical protein
VEFLHSGALVRAASMGAVALYQHLGPAHQLLQPALVLCCNAVGLGNELFARRHHRRRFSARRIALAVSAGPRRRKADPNPRRGARRRNDHAPNALRPGKVIRIYRTTRP